MNMIPYTEMRWKDKLVEDLSQLEPIPNCVYLNAPDFEGAGDYFLSVASLLYLLDQYKTNVKYVGSFRKTEWNKVNRSDTIVFQGGGNFGSMRFRVFRYLIDVVKRFPNKRIIVLPNSVSFTNNDMLAESILELNGHSNLTIITRDPVSLAFIQHNYPNCKTFMTTDMAFYLQDLIPELMCQSSNSTVYLRRDDKESDESNLNMAELPEGIPVHGWNQKMFYLTKRFRRKVKENRWYFENALAMLQYFITFINPLEYVYTEFLHGHVLCTMMRKPHTVLDTKQLKIRPFYSTWTSHIQWIKYNENSDS